MNLPSIGAIFEALFTRFQQRQLSDRDLKNKTLERDLAEANISNPHHRLLEWKRLFQENRHTRRNPRNPTSKLSAAEPDDAVSLKWNEVAPIIGAFGYNDLDTVISAGSYFDGNRRPLFISNEERENHYYHEGNDKSFRRAVKDSVWQERRLKNAFEGHRFMLEEIHLEPGQKTRGGRHYGHEAILVLSGKMEITLSDCNERLHKLSRGDFISFNSMQEHEASNPDLMLPAIGVVCKTLMAHEHGNYHTA